MVNLVGDSAITATPAVKGTNTANGVGVYGVNNTSSLHTGPCGVQGDSTHGIGVYGTSSDWYAVYGEGGIVGVRGVCYSASGYGVEATSTGATSYGLVANSPYQAINANCTGTTGSASAIAASGGLNCINASTSVNSGVVVNANASGTSAIAVNAAATGSYGVGLNASTGTITGKAITATAPYACISASSTGGGGTCIYGTTIGGSAIYGYATGTASYGVSAYGTTYGIYSQSAGTGGYFSGTTWGIYSVSAATAAYFGGGGMVSINGPATVFGYLTKSGGGYKVDHPTDPENKYLSHCFVESPEMMNIYRGHADFDDNGEATIALPSYFEGANENFEYGLTAISAAMPNLHLSEKVKNGAFKVAGGVAGKSVSWTVSAARSDKWAKANHPGVEIEKKADEKGFFMHPELFGHRSDKSVDPEVRSPRTEKPKAE